MTTDETPVSLFTIPVEQSSKLSRRRSILREFALNTSTHGIPGIARSQTWPNRIFWSCSFVIFSGITVFFITGSIRAYFNYPTQTSVKTIDPWPQNFPALTLCNLSPIRYDQFIESFLKYKNKTFYPNMTDPNSFPVEYIEDIDRFLEAMINNNEDLNPYFFPLSSMMVKCVFNGENCTVDDFTPFTSPVYGLCYVFNAKKKNRTNGGVFYSHEYGGQGRLSLSIYVHSHQYVPYFTEDVGIIALVHDNTELPRIQISGLHLTPGFRHRLTYRRRIDILQPPPYSDCSDEIPLSLKAMFQHYQDADFSYSQDLCMVTCIQAHNYDKCGCINPNRWDARRVVLPGADKFIVAPLCNDSDPCYYEATALLLDDNDVMMKYCAACVSQCTTTYFTVRSSFSKTPPKWSLNRIKQFLENVSSIPLPSDWSTDWQRHIYENYLSVDLIREVTSVETYVQEPTLGFLDVVANIGGHTGLWIGISFLSLMEFAEMLYRVARHQLSFLRKKFGS